MLPVRQSAKNKYWNHFIEQWVVGGHGGGHGVTGPRLRKIKHTIMTDDGFWDDIYWRHGGNGYYSPEEMAEREPQIYEHCLGNFWGMVMQTLVERGLVK